MNEKKKNGVYYTPDTLADYLVKPLIISENQKILDPSYGEGSLLLAAERAHLAKFKNKKCLLYGCDIKPVNGLLSHIPEANLIETDFFDYPLGNQYDTIVLNPPYIRHHNQDTKLVQRYRELYPDLNILNHRADIWSYFLIKTVLHLKEFGSIGAILPWSFLQAHYAIPLRLWLSKRFQYIKVVAFSNRFFVEAEERILILWLRNYKTSVDSIKIAFSEGTASSKRFLNISSEVWNSNKIINKENKDYQNLFSKYKKLGFTEFKNYANIKIGVVTGANEYFIKTRKDAQRLGFSKKDLIPIITRSSDFPHYLKLGKSKLKVLINLDERNFKKYNAYIGNGIKENIDLRAHSKRRTPWFKVKVDITPDAIFHYRAAKIPYMVMNNYNVQCTNSFHRIYFKNLNEDQIKWAIISLLSAPTQLTIEANSKCYGGGVLKIEPNSLKNSLILFSGKGSIKRIYKNVIQKLIANDKEAASRLATNFIYKNLNFSKDLINSTEAYLKAIRERRLNRITNI